MGQKILISRLSVFTLIVVCAVFLEKILVAQPDWTSVVIVFMCASAITSILVHARSDGINEKLRFIAFGGYAAGVHIMRRNGWLTFEDVIWPTTVSLALSVALITLGGLLIFLLPQRAFKDTSRSASGVGLKTGQD